MTAVPHPAAGRSDRDGPDAGIAALLAGHKPEKGPADGADVERIEVRAAEPAPRRAPAPQAAPPLASGKLATGRGRPFSRTVAARSAVREAAGTLWVDFVRAASVLEAGLENSGLEETQALVRTAPGRIAMPRADYGEREAEQVCDAVAAFARAIQRA